MNRAFFHKSMHVEVPGTCKEVLALLGISDGLAAHRLRRAVPAISVRVVPPAFPAHPCCQRQRVLVSQSLHPLLCKSAVCSVRVRRRQHHSRGQVPEIQIALKVLVVGLAAHKSRLLAYCQAILF
jgi:hypothetical protein